MSSSLAVLKTEIQSSFLLIDAGNTRTKAAIYQRNIALSSWIFDNENLAKAKEMLLKEDFSKVLIASSGKPGNEILNWFSGKSARMLTHQDSRGIRWAYAQPDRLGIDRIAGMLGASYLFPDENVCIVDGGTCITTDFLLANKTHIGGFISPGLEMRLQAMHEKTSKLPHVSKNQISVYPGIDTESCLSGGVVWGATAEIEAHFKWLCSRFSGPHRLILCGGDADFLAQRIKADNFVVPDLVIQGLNAVLSDSV